MNDNKSKPYDFRFLEHIGRRIRYFRERCKLTQEQLATRVGSRAPYISRIEWGTSYGLTMLYLKAIADELGVQVSDLVGDSNLLLQSFDYSEQIKSELVRIPKSEQPAAVNAVLAILRTFQQLSGQPTFDPRQLTLPFERVNRKGGRASHAGRRQYKMQ